MPSKATPKPLKFLSKSRLREVWDETKKKSSSAFSAAGVDRIRGAQFAQNLDRNISILASEIARGEFHFSALHPVWIPKRGSKNKERLICVPTVRDRLVQRVLVRTLSANNRLKLSSEVSFGFQEGLGVKSAIEKACSLRQSNAWVVKTDVCSFFDRINRKYMIDKFVAVAPKSFISLIPLIAQIVNCEVKAKPGSETLKLRDNGIIVGKGLRQGMPISPMLSNLELREFDSKAVKAGYKMTRYADDIAIFCSSKTEAIAVLKNCEQWLKELGHEIPKLGDDGKTKIFDPNESVEFLGFDLVLDQSQGLYRVKIPQRSFDKIFEQIRSSATLAYCEVEKWNLSEYVKNLNAKKSAYRGAYSYASNYDEFLLKLESNSRNATRELLKEIFGSEALKKLSDKKLKFLGIDGTFDDEGASF
jgi:RNA-directed DNA polymerase